MQALLFAQHRLCFDAGFVFALCKKARHMCRFGQLLAAGVNRTNVGHRGLLHPFCQPTRGCPPHWGLRTIGLAHGRLAIFCYMT